MNLITSLLIRQHVCKANMQGLSYDVWRKIKIKFIFQMQNPEQWRWQLDVQRMCQYLLSTIVSLKISGAESVDVADHLSGITLQNIYFFVRRSCSNRF